MNAAKPTALAHGRRSRAVLLAVLADVLAFSAYSVEPTDGGTLLFLGNRNIAPVAYIKNEVPTGVAVDITRALARHLRHPVEIKIMDWPTAQALVARG